MYKAPDDDIVNEQEQNKPLNLADEPEGSFEKEKAFEEGIKNDTASVNGDSAEAINADKAKD